MILKINLIPERKERRLPVTSLENTALYRERQKIDYENEKEREKMKLQVQQIGRRKSKANEKKPKCIRTCKDLNCKFHLERNCKRK